MKVKTTYNVRIEASYVNWNGDLELRGDDGQTVIEATIDLKTLKNLHKQIGERVVRLEDEQLEEARKRLEKVNDE